jgi:hypothetical protein
VASVGGCAFWQEPSLDPSARAQRPRDTPDDRDLAALIPTGVDTVIEVDIGRLRQSPWTSGALAQQDQTLRRQKAEALGYDVTDDVDQMVYAVTAAGIQAPTLAITRGRFQMPTVEAAFRARWPGATADRWRNVLVLASGENALASLTARTFVSGAPERVQAVIDRSLGVAPGDDDAGAGRGALRRDLLGDSARAAPALMVTAALGPDMRKRIETAFALPPELTRLGARLDVGESLDLEALGLLTSREAAQALARQLTAQLNSLQVRAALGFLGLSNVVRGVRIGAEGAQVRARLSVPAEQRETVTAALRAIVQALRKGTDPSMGGSW